MSTCISSHGEFGEHEPNMDHYCVRCWTLDGEGLLASRNRLWDALDAADRVGLWLEAQVAGRDDSGSEFDKGVLAAVCAYRDAIDKALDGDADG